MGENVFRELKKRTVEGDPAQLGRFPQFWHL